MISVDGYSWDVPCDLKRTATMAASDVSGMLLNGVYYKDVIGTYLTYDMTLAVPPEMDAEYDVLYDILTQPVDHHTFVLPYGRGTVELVAHIDAVKDVLVYTVSKKQYWRGVTCSISASHPTKVQGTADAIAYGISPKPNAEQVPEGTILMAVGGAWVQRNYDDADARRY